MTFVKAARYAAFTKIICPGFGRGALRTVAALENCQKKDSWNTQKP